ncbi:MAG: hypothetical protein CV081_11145 [Nitrospira sp. LK265]|nr:hypothetical protein [Nitrospira sp. LK265]
MTDGKITTSVLVVRKFLKRMIQSRFGSMSGYAKASNVSLQYVSNVLTGIKPIPDWMLKDFEVSHVVAEHWIIPMDDPPIDKKACDVDELSTPSSQTLTASKPTKIVALEWDDTPVIRIEHAIGRRATFLFSGYDEMIRRTVEFYICPNPDKEYLVLWMREKPMRKRDVDPNDDYEVETASLRFEHSLAYCSSNDIPLSSSALWMIVAVLRTEDSACDMWGVTFRKAGLLTSTDLSMALAMANTCGT